MFYWVFHDRLIQLKDYSTTTALFKIALENKQVHPRNYSVCGTAVYCGELSQPVDMHEVILQARNLRTRMHNRKKEFASADP